MNTADEKLTLKLDKGAIQRAKAHARARGTSVSRLVEGFFEQLSAKPESSDELELPPLVRALSGVAPAPPDYDHRKEYEAHVLRKRGQS